MNKVVDIHSTPKETAAEWHGFTEEDLRRPGAALLVWLAKVAIQRGEKMHQPKNRSYPEEQIPWQPSKRIDGGPIPARTRLR